MSDATTMATGPEFTEALAHELRHDVSAVLHQAELLRNDELDENGRRRSLDAIESNAEGLLRLTDDLTELGRIIRGETIASRRPISVADLIVGAVRDRARPFGWRSPGCSNAREWAVDTDPLLVRRVLSGLLDACCGENDVGDDTVTAGALRSTEEFVDIVVTSDQASPPTDDGYRELTIADGLSMLLVSASAQLVGGSVAIQGIGRARTFRLRLPRAYPGPAATSVAD